MTEDQANGLQNALKQRQHVLIPEKFLGNFPPLFIYIKVLNALDLDSYVRVIQS